MLNRLLLVTGVWSAGAAGAAGGTASSTSPPEHALDPVVVQAQRQPQDLQSVPMSVEVLPTQELEAARVKDLYAMGAYSASVTTGGVSRVGLARLGLRGINDLARNQGFEGSVAVYVDGVYAGRQQGLSQSLVGIEQVEVLRGPQGTLFGRNSIAGALQLITRKPEEQWSTSASLDRGQTGIREAGIWTGGPLADPRLKMAFTAALTYQDGYVDNLFRPDNRPTQAQTGLLRTQLRWTPSRDVTVDALMERWRYDGQRYNGEAVEPGTPAFLLAPGPWSTAVDTRSTEAIDRDAASLRVEARLDAQWRLISITGWQQHAARYDAAEGDWTPADLIQTVFAISRTRQSSQEVQLHRQWAQGTQLQLGALVMDQRNAERFSSATGADFPAAGSPRAGTFTGRSTLGDGALRLNTQAVFAHGQWTPWPLWTAVAGVRYTRERKEVRFGHEADPLLASAGLYPLAPFTARIDDHDTSPRLGLSRQLTPEAQAYVTRSTGFKSGGYNLDGITSVLTDPARQLRFEASRVTTTEWGLKSEWMDRRLRINAALYDTAGRDFQVQQFVTLPAGGTQISITNAGRVRIQGGELEARLRLNPTWTLWAATHQSDARFEEFLNGGGLGVHFNGNQLPYAPRSKWLMGVLVQGLIHGHAWSAQLHHTRVGEQFSNADNRARNRIAPYALTGGRLSLSGRGALEGWSLSAWGQNLGDRAYLISQDRSFTGVIKGPYGPPRTLGLSVSLER